MTSINCDVSMIKVLYKLLIIFMGMSAFISHVEATDMSRIKLHIQVGKEVLTATLIDNQTSRDFVAMLPKTMVMKDYSSTEKISYLPRKLAITGAPAGVDPSVGDICYYAPWGNIAIFYEDFGYAKGLIKLGAIDNGIETLSNIREDFEAYFELVD